MDKNRYRIYFQWAKIFIQKRRLDFVHCRNYSQWKFEVMQYLRTIYNDTDTMEHESTLRKNENYHLESII